MSTVSAVVLWRAFILSHIALHCYLFFPGFVRGKQNKQTKACRINTSKSAIEGVNIKAGELCDTSAP